MKTIKGYGLGEAAKGRTSPTTRRSSSRATSVKKFRDRFGVPIADEELDKLPFYKPAEDSPEMAYLRARREQLGGYLPDRKPTVEKLRCAGA